MTTPSDPFPAVAPPTTAEESWQRLHPVSLLLRAVVYAQRLVLPAIIVFVFARQDRWQYWLLVAFVPAVAFEVFRYFTLRYRLGPDELIVRRGLLFRGERHIPFARIQNINLVQGVLHRMFGVADVTIETASGGEPEAVLKVLSTQAVAEMRQRVFRENRAEAPISDEAAGAGQLATGPAVPAAHAVRELILNLRPKELVILGMVTVRGLAMIAVLFGLSHELDLWDRLDLAGWIRREVESGFADVPGALLAIAAFVAVPVLIVLSIAWSILRFYGYRLEAAGEDLHLSAGLFTRRSATVPRHRIQFVTVRESILHRLFGRASVRIETAAGAGGGDQKEETNERLMAQRWFIPIARRQEIAPILRRVHPRLDLEGITWIALPPRARARMIKRNAGVALLVALPIVAVFWPWGLVAPPVLLLFALWHAWRSAAITAWSRPSFGVMFRSGVLTRQVSATFFEKVQVVSVRETPFDRRYGMARLTVDTAGHGPAGHSIEIPYLPRATADRLACGLLYEATHPASSRYYGAKALTAGPPVSPFAPSGTGG